VHDGPAQVLANAMFEVEYLERIADRATGEARTALKAELANLKSQFRASLDAVRGMIYDLRPPILSELGLAGAIRNYATEYQARYDRLRGCPPELDLVAEAALIAFAIPKSVTTGTPVRVSSTQRSAYCARLVHTF